MKTLNQIEARINYLYGTKGEILSDISLARKEIEEDAPSGGSVFLMQSVVRIQQLECRLREITFAINELSKVIDA